MARWGDFVWGDGTLWGVPGTTRPRLTWLLQIDWDGDGAFSGDNEGARAYAMNCRRGREFILRSDNQGFEVPRVGKLEVSLRNNDGRYTPGNTSSLLYPYVRPGVLARLKVLDEVAETEYPVFYGRVADIRALETGGRNVKMSIEDGMRILQADVTTDLYENIRFDDALGVILDAVGWPSAWGRDLGSDSQTIPLFWVDGQSASSVIQEIMDAGLGVFYIANDGKATYKPYSSADSTEATLDGTEILDDVSTPQPWEVIRNSIRMNVFPYAQQGVQDVWTYGETLSIAAGQTRIVWAEYTYNDSPVSAINAEAPVANTDYTANTQEGGGGVDITADITVTVLSQFSKTAKLSITNDPGGSDGYMTLLKQRADPIAYDNASFAKEEDDDSIDIFGKQTLTISSPWVQKQAVADGFSAFLLSQYADARQFPRVSIANNPAVQFGTDLFSIVSQTIADIGISDTFRIGEIAWDWYDETGQTVNTKYRLEPFVAIEGYWQFTTTIGETSIFAPP